MNIAVLFPGQGTQMSRMGEPWRGHPAWSVVERAESVVGQPLEPLLLDDVDAARVPTRDVQLAVLLMSLMAWSAIRDAVGAPVAFAGHSLGQVTALIAAGALDLDDGVRLAVRRAECTQRASDRHEGRMAALLGASLSEAEQVCRAGQCWIANDNAPGQVVIGGTPAGVEGAAERARRLGVRRVIPLKVGGAFHTPLMDDARRELLPFLETTRFRPSPVPVVSNVDARPYQDGDGWAARLADHLVRPVQWRRSMETLVGLGATTFLEAGPGTVLGGLARRTVPDTDIRSVAVPDDVPSLMEVA